MSCKPTYKGVRYDSIDEIKSIIIQEKGLGDIAQRLFNVYSQAEQAGIQIEEPKDMVSLKQNAKQQLVDSWGITQKNAEHIVSVLESIANSMARMKWIDNPVSYFENLVFQVAQDPNETANARYRIHSSKRFVELLKKANEITEQEAITAAIHEAVFHDAFFNMVEASKNNPEARKDLETVISEFNKFYGKNITPEQIIQANDDFKNNIPFRTEPIVQNTPVVKEIGKPEQFTDPVIGQKRSEVDGKRLSEFKKDDIVYRNYNGKYEEFLITDDSKDLWKLRNVSTGNEITLNANGNEGFILKDQDLTDYEMISKVGNDLFKQLQRNEELRGLGPFNRKRLLETANNIKDIDKKDKILPEHIIEASFYEEAYLENFENLRSAIELGGIDYNAKLVQRQLEVGVNVPKDIVDKFITSELYKNASPDLISKVDKIIGNQNVSAETKTTIQDFGEKIGGARKDKAVSGFSRGETKKEEKSDLPAWRRRYKVGEITVFERVNGEKQERTFITITDTRTGNTINKGYRPIEFKTIEEAELVLPAIVVSLKHRIYTSRENPGKYSIYKIINDKKMAKVVEQDFDSKLEAETYLALMAEKILETSISFGEEVLPTTATPKRVGKEYRIGDVTPDDFMAHFGFRGVEFGNWNNQQERQEVMNHAFDGLMDLARVLGISSRAISLGGELGLAFGSRGAGLSGAAAHYERDYAVINLTKMKGSGTLAHEWFHAFDHYMGRLEGVASSEKKQNSAGDTVFITSSPKRDFLTSSYSYKTKMRKELRDAYLNLARSFSSKAEKYVEDSTLVENYMKQARENLQEELTNFRNLLTRQRSYGRKKDPANAQQLAEVDRIIKELLNYQTEIPLELSVNKRSKSLSFPYVYSNKHLDELAAIYIDVYGKSPFSKDGNAPLDVVGRRIRSYNQRYLKLQDANQGVEKEKRVKTDFFVRSSKMDETRSKDYWSTQWELGARAFEGYVEDKIFAEGNKSEFLVYWAHNPVPTFLGNIYPYPEGKEREIINQLFDEFFALVQEKTDEYGNVSLYQDSVNIGIADNPDYVAVQEFFARAGEKYLTEGDQGFTPELQTIFDKIREIFRSVYNSIASGLFDIPLTMEMKNIFGKILGKEYVETPDIPVDPIEQVQEDTEDDDIPTGEPAEEQVKPISELKTSDLQDKNQRYLNEKYLSQIPEFKDLSERVKKAHDEYDRISSLLMPNKDLILPGPQRSQRLSEVGLPNTPVHVYRLLYSYINKSKADRMPEDIKNLTDDVEEFEEYLKNVPSDEEIKAVAEKYDNITIESKKSKEIELQAFKQTQQRKEQLFEAAKPFIRFLYNQIGVETMPENNGFLSYAFEKNALLNNESKENMFKVFHFTKMYNEFIENNKEHVSPKKQDTYEIYKLLKKVDFNIDRIVKKNTDDLFVQGPLQELNNKVRELNDLVSKYDFKEGDIAAVPEIIDSEIDVAKARLEELQQQRKDAVDNAPHLLGPIAQEILRLKDFISSKQQTNPEIQSRKKSKLDELKNALRENRLSDQNLGFAYDPKGDADRKAKLLKIAVEIIDIYIEEGILKFAEIVKDAMQMANDYSKDFLNALKSGYLTAKIYGADLPDSFEDVNSFEYGDGSFETPGTITNEQKEKLEETRDEKTAELDSLKEDDSPESEVKQIDVQETIDKINDTLGDTEDLYQKFVDAFNNKEEGYRDILRQFIIKNYLAKGMYPFRDIVIDMNNRIPVEPFFREIKIAYHAIKNQNIEGYAGLMSDMALDTYESIFNTRTPKELFIQEVKKRIDNKEKLNIVALRKIATDVGFPEDVVDTELQEYAEYVIVEKARDIYGQNADVDERFQQILDLYDLQPTISMRTNVRIENQQYSTPIPMGFVAAEFINAKSPQKVLEPSAGNGMMVYGINKNKITANEIDPIRRSNLADMGFAKVTDQDAMLPFEQKQYDAIVMNPPFGSSAPKTVGGMAIAGKDPLMAINALDSMKDDGRAVIIIGGHNTYTQYGMLSGHGQFFQYLYKNYNVKDVINMAGDLYAKQGTKFPTRMILIDGRRPPGGERVYAPTLQSLSPDKAKVVETFEELLNRVNTFKDEIFMPQRPSGADNDDKRTTGGQDNRGNDGVQGTLFGPEQPQGGGRSTGSGSRGSSGSVPGKRSGRGSNDNANGPNAPNTTRTPGAIADISPEEEITIDIRRNDIDVLPGESDVVDITLSKVPYVPQSKGPQIGSMIPVNMSTPLYSILRQFGDIDEYVRQKLRYVSKEDLYKALAAEQIDSVALAIYQIEQGSGFIIGDMTGVGKGRQGAAIIRYAILQGKKPIFFTEKASLFSDMYADLLDIGSVYRPLLAYGKNGERDPSILDKKDPDIVLHKALSNEKLRKIYDSNEVPDEYDFVMTTYSQYNRADNDANNQRNKKKQWIEEISKDNIFIFDESHNMSSSAKQARHGGASKDTNTGAFFKSLVPNFKGGVFMSATFAKTPQNMPVYALKTDISKANMESSELIQAILNGGVPLQEVMSANLVQSGQMIRRERDFSDVEFDWVDLKTEKDRHVSVYNNIIEIFNDIVELQNKYVQPIIDDVGTTLAGQGQRVENRGRRDFGTSNTPFANRTFNAVRQLLFSLIAEDIANQAIFELKNGRKPFIAVANTMESFVEEMGLEYGDVIENADFSLVLNKGIASIFKYKKIIDGEQFDAEVKLTELSPEGRDEYEKIKYKINNTFTGITVSPIDHIISIIERAGYTVGEITGRSTQFSVLEDGKYQYKKRENKQKEPIIYGFNNGGIDVIIANQSGSTGLSAHASEKVLDQRQRVMIFGQAQLDVNIEVQMMGRIDRTGQVHRGIFRYLLSAIPAQKRLLMMLKTKLKSLTANTTSSQKSETTDLKVVDFINKYGDRIAYEYLIDNPDINDKLRDPFEIAGKDDVSPDDVPVDAALKISGKIALLNAEDQEKFYDEVAQKYEDYIEYLNETDSNDLEMKTLNLEAVTLDSTTLVEGIDNSNPFAQDTFLEKVEINVLKKPMKSHEIISDITGFIGEPLSDDSRFNYKQKLRKELDDFLEHEIDIAVRKLELSRDNKEKTLIEKARVAAVREGEELGYSPEMIQESIDDNMFIVEYNRNKARGFDNYDDYRKVLELISSSPGSKYADSETKREFKEKHEMLLNNHRVSVENVKNKKRLDKTKVSAIINGFSPGKIYKNYIPVRDETSGNVTNEYKTVPAVFLGFNYKEDKMRSSQMKAVFATKDGRRRIQIPFKEEVLLDYMRTAGEVKNLDLETWDKGVPDILRKTAYMITGNLLQSYGVNKQGQLVSYTTKEGKIKQGRLMPDNYDPGTQEVNISVDKAGRHIKAGYIVVSSNREVTIEKDVLGGYRLYVPLSTKNGAKYFNNSDLRSFVKNGLFSQSNGRMMANVREENLEDMLKYMKEAYNMFVKVELPEGRNISSNTRGMSNKNINTDYESMVDQMIRSGDIQQVDLTTEKKCDK